MTRQRWILAGLFLFIASHCCWAREGPIPSGRRSAVVAVVDKAKAAVVNIQSERVTYSSSVPGQSTVLNRANGMGTGIVIDPRGYIITNHHVVEDVTTLKVRLADGANYTAQVLCKDKEKDLAIVKIQPNRPLPTLTLGTSSDLMTGESVIAIGNAFGYEHTVSVGIVSQLHRDVVLNREVAYKDLIQTDASINPGNSGGPLLNVDGELVGVNVAIRAGANGISFALPIDQVTQGVADMLARRRKAEMALGFQHRNVTRPGRDPGLHALIVEEVMPESTAGRAGLKTGDQIVALGGTAIRCGMDLECALCERHPGEKLPLRVLRQGKTVELEWVLQAAGEAGATLEKAWRILGVKLSTTSASATAQPGLYVADVRPGGPAARAGIQAGDLLAGLHVWETTQLDHVAFVLNHADLRTFAPLKFHVYRSGTLHRGQFAALDD